MGVRAAGTFYKTSGRAVPKERLSLSLSLPTCRISHFGHENIGFRELNLREAMESQCPSATGSIAKLSSFAISLLVLLSCFSFTSTDAYDALDPTGNITIKWDVMSWTPDGYVAVVTMYNFQQYRHIQAPGWTLGWTWAKKEVIWSMMGGQTTEQGDCS
ncbi:hypothetical protein TIFTF001_045587, partial [Ficus carica]